MTTPAGWIECVPNVSEGRDTAVIDAIAEAADTAPGAVLLDVDADPWHHRTVLTIAGEPTGVAIAARQVAAAAVRLIDLSDHDGVHPRNGAVDVIPFAPLGATPLETCIGVARSVAVDIADAHRIPVYLYGAAAAGPDSLPLPLPQLRRDLRATVAPPDHGPPHRHPTAGVVAVGARPVLVAFNVYLDSTDPTDARRIAQRIRESSGGRSGLLAKGFLVAGRAQVSMNLVALERTTPQLALAAVDDAAAALGIPTAESELVGLVPADAVRDSTTASLRMRDELDDRILEHRLAARWGIRTVGPRPEVDPSV